MSIPREVIHKVVDEEREYQIKKGYDAEHEADHSLWDFLMHMEEQLRNAKYAVNSRFEPLEHVRNLAALAFATMEKFGYVRRYDGEVDGSREMWQ